MVDSGSSNAIEVSGLGDVDASATDVVGGARTSGWGHVDNPHKGQPAVGDPLGSLAAPSTSGLTVQSTRTLRIDGWSHVTLQPGVYNGGINIDGFAKVTLAPGVYYLNGGGLNVNGLARVSGNGVLIYNAPAMHNDQINIGGFAKVDLTPMTTGVYAGISIFQDRTSSNDISVSGLGSLDVHGSIYAASAEVDISGVGSIDTFGSTLIADDLDVSGLGDLII